MGSDDIFYEADFLGAVLSQEVCVGLKRGEVVFSRSALVRAKSHTCLVELGEGFGDRLDSSVIEYLMRRRGEANVDVDSDKHPLVSRLYVVERQKIIFFQMMILPPTGKAGFEVLINDLSGVFLTVHIQLSHKLG